MALGDVLKQYSERHQNSELLEGVDVGAYEIHVRDTYESVKLLSKERKVIHDDGIRRVYQAVDMGVRQFDGLAAHIYVQPRIECPSTQRGNSAYSRVELEVLTPRVETDDTEIFHADNSIQIGLISFHFGLPPTQENWQAVENFRQLLWEMNDASRQSAPVSGK